MDSKKADVKLEVKEEPDYVYIDETVCCVKLEEKDETVALKQEEGASIVAAIGICPELQQPQVAQEERQVQDEQKSHPASVGSKRKILPRPQIQIQNLDLSPKVQANTSRSRKILPWPHIAKDMIQSQPLLSAEPPISQTVPLNNIQTIAPRIISQNVGLQHIQPSLPHYMQLPCSSQPGRAKTSRNVKERNILPAVSNQSQFASTQHLSSAVPLQQVKSIPVSAQNITTVQYQSLNSANIQQTGRTNQPFQSLVSGNTHQVLPLNQLQNIPSVTSNQLKPLQNISLVNSAQQNIQTANVHYCAPLQPLEKVASVDTLQSLHPLSSGGIHHTLPMQSLPNVSSNLIQELTEVKQTNMQGTVPVQIDTKVATQNMLAIQSAQAINPNSGIQNISLQQLQNTHPCTRSAVSFPELRNFSSITTQAVSLQSQCNLTTSEQQNIPIQAVNPLSTINSCSTLPVQLQALSNNPVAQQQLNSRNTSVIPQQQVPIQQMCSNSHMNGQQNINFQQVQSLPQPLHNQLSLQEIGSTNLPENHLMQLHNVQSIVPDAGYQSIPLHQIQTSTQLHPVHCSSNQNEVASVSSVEKLTLNKIQAVAPEHSNTEVQDNKRKRKRKRKRNVIEITQKRKILPRPLLATTSLPQQKPTTLPKPSRKILPRPLLSTALITLQEPTVVTSIAQRENLLLNSSLIQVQATTTPVNLNCPPISKTLPVNNDIRHSVPPSHEQQYGSFSSECFSMPEHQETVEKSPVENVTPCQLLKSSVNQITGFDMRNKTIDGAHATTSFCITENANPSILETLAENQDVTKEIPISLATKSNASVQTTKDFDGDSNENIVSNQEEIFTNTDTVNTSLRCPLVECEEYNLENKPASFSQLQNSCGETADELVSVSNEDDSTAGSILLSYNEVASLDIGQCQQYNDSIDTSVCYQEKVSGLSNTGNSHHQDFQAELCEPCPKPLQNDYGMTLLSLEKEHNNSSTAFFPHQLEQVSSCKSDSSSRSGITTVSQDFETFDNMSNTVPTTQQKSTLLCTTDVYNETCAVGHQGNDHIQNREDTSVAVYQLSDQGEILHPPQRKYQRKMKRLRHCQVRYKRNLSTSNIKGFGLLCQQKRKLTQVRYLRQKLTSQEQKIQKLQKDLEEERKKNEILTAALLKVNCRDEYEVNFIRQALHLSKDYPVEVVKDMELKNGQEIGDDSNSELSHKPSLQVMSTDGIFQQNCVSQSTEFMTKVWSPGVGSDDSEGVR